MATAARLGLINSIAKDKKLFVSESWSYTNPEIMMKMFWPDFRAPEKALLVRNIIVIESKHGDFSR